MDFRATLLTCDESVAGLSDLTVELDEDSA